MSFRGVLQWRFTAARVPNAPLTERVWDRGLAFRGLGAVGTFRRHHTEPKSTALVGPFFEWESPNKPCSTMTSSFGWTMTSSFDWTPAYKRVPPAGKGTPTFLLKGRSANGRTNDLVSGLQKLCLDLSGGRKFGTGDLLPRLDPPQNTFTQVFKGKVQRKIGVSF